MLEFDIPKGMTNEIVARTFTAYLLGSVAFEGLVSPSGELTRGPYKKRPESDDHWQLDQTNDFFLHIYGTQGVIACRYPSQKPVIEAAVALFRARHERSPAASAAA